MALAIRLATLLGVDYCEACGWWTKPGCGH